MISEETAKRVADALERLAGMLEKLEKPPMMRRPNDIDPGFAVPDTRCSRCGTTFGPGAWIYACSHLDCPMGAGVLS